jgi:hypothetical protein
VTQAPELSKLSVAEKDALILELLAKIASLERLVADLRDENARLKGVNARPQIKPSKPSGMEDGNSPKPGDNRKRRRRGKVMPKVKIEEQTVTAAAPAGSRFKGYEDYVVQDLVLQARVIRYRRERWVTPDGRTIVAPLPDGVAGHFGPELRRYILMQYHQGQVTVPRLVAQLQAIGVSISKRQVVRLLNSGQEGFLTEARDVLRAGLEQASWVTVDDTGARHQARNGYCTQIGNENFAWFGTTYSKSRLNFLELLRAGYSDYVVNDAAVAYMKQRALAGPTIALLAEHPDKQFADATAWTAHLEQLGITKLTITPDPVQIATEGALWGSVQSHEFLRDAVIVSDDAGQFAVGQHGLCWVQYL